LKVEIRISCASSAGELGATIIPADQEEGEKARGGVLLILEERAY